MWKAPNVLWDVWKKTVEISDACSLEKHYLSTLTLVKGIITCWLILLT